LSYHYRDLVVRPFGTTQTMGFHVGIPHQAGMYKTTALHVTVGFNTALGHLYLRRPSGVSNGVNEV
jgi:hypothetical protein